MRESADERVDGLLTHLLGRTIEFVKFAEAKNAALFTFATASVVASINVAMNDHFIMTSWALVLAQCGLAMIVASLAVAVFSFLPKIRPATFIGETSGDLPNLLFFGDIAGTTPAKLSELVREAYSCPKGRRTLRYWRDLSCQIYINARIARFKFNCFSIAVYLLGVGAFLYGISAVVFFVSFWR